MKKHNLKIFFLLVFVVGTGLALSVKTSSFFAGQTETKKENLASISEFGEKSALPGPANIEQIDLEAEAAQIFDLQNNYKILSVNSDKRWPLASLTKLMTSLVALENFPLDKIIGISSRAREEGYGGAGDFSAGEKFMVEDLVKAMMAVSSNEAALALAENLPKAEFVNLMNKKAAELGMVETYFYEPTGVSLLNQTSAKDITRLVKYIWQNQERIFLYSRQPKIEITERGEGKKREFSNINKFAGRGDFLGGKTGFTEDAQGNLISIFSLNERPILIVVFGTKDRFAETEKLLNFVSDKK
jgi:D-alanyl-D-alanine carboxypeptidase